MLLFLMMTSRWFDFLIFQTVSVTVSILTLTFISIDRWYAICFPLRFKSTTGWAKNAIIGIWTIALLFGSSTHKIYCFPLNNCCEWHVYVLFGIRMNRITRFKIKALDMLFLVTDKLWEKPCINTQRLCRYSGSCGVAYRPYAHQNKVHFIHTMWYILESKESSHLHYRQINFPLYWAFDLHERSVLADCKSPLEKRHSRA